MLIAYYSVYICIHMKSITKHIPNLFTLANLCCGILAIILFLTTLPSFYKIFVSGENRFINFLNTDGNSILITEGILFILLATIFDFLDGLAAKLLKAQSPMGAQLDSLADMVTFGVAPGILMYVISITNIDLSLEYYISPSILHYLAFLIPIFSALRLAKFNVDTEQTDYFKGTPTPANAIFWIGIVLAMINGVNIHPTIISILIVTMSLLMMSNMKMLSFKFKNLSFSGDNIYRYLLIIVSGLLITLCSLLGNFFLAIPLVIILYILLSIPFHISKTKRT